MDAQDVITYTQPTVKVINEEKTVEIMRDENLWPVLRYLQRGPMSINDLVNLFKKDGEEKSDKTIYRYLHDLIEAKLVAKAGKRIASIKEDELTSETLYMRSAKVFIYPEALKHLKDAYEKGFCPIFDTTRLIIKPLVNNRALNSDRFQKLFFRIDEELDRYILDLFNNASEETIKKFNELDSRYLDLFLDYLGWIVLITKLDLKKELEKC